MRFLREVDKALTYLLLQKPSEIILFGIRNEIMAICKYLLFSTFVIVWFKPVASAQSTKVDSLLNLVKNENDDSLKVTHYIDLGLEYIFSEPKTAIDYFDEALNLAGEIEYKSGLAKAHNSKGRAFAAQGNLMESFVNFQEALKIFHEISDKTGEANVLSNLGSIYYMTGNSSKALEYHFESLKISEVLENKLRIGTSYNNIGTVYLKNSSTINEALTFFKKSLDVFKDIDYTMGMATASMNIGEVYFGRSEYDSAMYYLQIALDLSDGTIDATFPLTQLGQINAALGNFQKAYSLHKRALNISEKLGAKFELAQSLLGLAKTQRKMEDYQNAVITFERAKSLAMEIDAKNELVDAYLNLAEIHALTEDYKAAYENEINAKAVKEEIAKSSTEQMIQELQFEFELDKKEAEIALLQKDTELKNAAVFNQRIIIFTALGGLLMFVIISFYLFRNNLNKQKANRLLQIQKEEIHLQRENAESAFEKLKSTQAQLIQSEKMASLGELTAGIAHEIKNPLNFVNNFSEVCAELLDEMKEELQGGNQKLALEIADDIKLNLEKINNHGKRADSIVKGMLEHSRTSIGERVETDLNALATEYFRLSYHGLKAKDNNFRVDLVMDLDSELPKAKVNPQDFVRVLLNLFNNAFYVVNEKLSQQGMENYQPSVRLSTKQVNQNIVIEVSDNGLGIPEAIKDKIFQPFFTTKPTGKGTGLGLSLSYDIVKSHGGTISVSSQAGMGTDFIVTLPIT
jgi:two-component system, NtrC family, sensor kinase